MMTNERHTGLERFLEAQEPVYDQVRVELRAGRKRGHWMWFVFPQVAGLGRSVTARWFAIRSLDEANVYLADPVLGPRLRECAELTNAVTGKTAVEIFGDTDAMKLRSSMTLFSRAASDNRIFEAVLGHYFHAEHDAVTLGRLEEVGPADLGSPVLRKPIS
jgi:uncharacterized protein (DUF1810 family)